MYTLLFRRAIQGCLTKPTPNKLSLYIFRRRASQFKLIYTFEGTFLRDCSKRLYDGLVIVDLLLGQAEVF